MSTAVHADIDAMSHKVYTPVDKAHFYENFVNSLTQYHSMDDKEDKAAISVLKTIFRALCLKAEAGVALIGKELEAALVALCRQADGRADALATNARIKQAATTIGDVRLRQSLEYSVLVQKMQEKGLAETLLDSLCDREELKTQGAIFAKSDSAMTAIAQICPSLTEFMAQKDESSMTKLMQSLIAAKSAGAMTHVADAVQPHFNHLDTASGIKANATHVYMAALDEFRADFGKLARYVVGTQAKVATSMKPDEACELKKKIADSIHVLKQKAEYSDSTSHDREAIDTVQQVLPVCEKADAIMSCAEPPESASKVAPDFDAATYKGLTAVLRDLNVSKPKLTWCLGEQEAGHLVDALRAFSQSLEPIQEAKQQVAMKAVAQAGAILKSMLVDDGSSDDDLFSAFTPAKMEKVRSKRNILKAANDQAQAVFKKMGLDEPHELRTNIELAESARRQTIKFGFLAMTRSPDVNMDSKIGAGIRENLKSIWATHTKDEAMKKYMGDALVTIIQEINAGVGERSTGAKRKPQPAAQAAKGASKADKGDAKIKKQRR